MKNALFCSLIAAATLCLGDQPARMVKAGTAHEIRIDLKHGTPREARTKATLEGVLAQYDLSKYIFTQKVVIEQGVINHAFPVLTLNARFADSPDELLSSFLHEQLHWYLRDHKHQERAAVADLQQFYPRVPVGLPEGAETLYSTYGHLIDCYLEIQADRQLIGDERTRAVINSKGHYTWIYATILRDEPRIAGIAAAHSLHVD